MTIKKVVTSADIDNKTIVINADNKLEAVSSGSSEFNLNNLESKSYQTGSTPLAVDANGNLYKVLDTKNIFKDISLSLEQVGQVTNTEQGTTYTIKAKVNNNTDAATGEVTVSLYVPVPLSQVTMDSDITQSDKTFTIPSISGYSSKSITVTVHIDSDTYFSGSVSTSNDIVSSNDTAQLELKAVAKNSAANNVYTDECPLIGASYNGTELTGSKQIEKFVSVRESLNNENISYNILNIDSLAGKTFNFAKASTIRVFGDKASFPYNATVLIKEVANYQYKIHHYSTVDSGSYSVELTPEDYSFNVSTGDLKFSDNLSNVDSVIVAVRPNGSTCMWQIYQIVGNSRTVNWNVVSNRIAVTGLNNSLYTYQIGNFNYLDHNIIGFSNLPIALTDGSNKHLIGDTLDNYMYISDSISVNNETFQAYTGIVEGSDRYDGTLGNPQIEETSVLHISLPQGSNYEFSLTNIPKGTLPETQGNITITWNGSGYSVQVLSTASATDNIQTDKVSISLV